MPEDAPESPRRVGRWVAGCGLALLLVCGGSGAFVSMRLSARVDEGVRAAERVRREIARHGARRWQRPVLRGEPIPGNAADAARMALAEIARLPNRSELGELLDGALEANAEGRPSPEGLAPLLQRTEGARGALRRATRLTWAARPMAQHEDLGRTDPGDSPSAALLATKLLLAGAMDASPSECMATAADVVRLGQDLSAGANLLHRMMLDAHARRAAPVLLRCAARATPEELAVARAEVERLAAHSPPASWTFEIEALGMARVLVSTLPESPWPSDAQRVEALSMLETSLSAIDHQLGAAARWRAREREGPTGVVRGTEDEDRRADASDNALVSIVGIPYRSYGRRTARVEAILRGLVVSLDAIEHAKRAAGPLPAQPTRLADPRLRDPLGGGPLRWVLDHGGRRATLSWTHTAPTTPSRTDAGTRARDDAEDALTVSLP